MNTLTIDFQEGFRDDSAIVLVNGLEVFRRSGLTTRTQIGFAGSFSTELPEGPARLVVSMPSRGASEEIVVDTSSPVHVGVSVSPEGKISLSVSDKPYGYL